MPVKKTISKKSKESSKKQEEELMSSKWTQEDHEEESDEEVDAKEVEDGEDTNPQKQSIVNFDHDEVKALNKKKVEDVNNMELLKVLVIRGEESFNPALKKGVEKLMKMLNGEFLGPRRRFNPRQGGRGRGGRPFLRNYRDRFHPGAGRRNDRRNQNEEQDE